MRSPKRRRLPRELRVENFGLCRKAQNLSSESLTAAGPINPRNWKRPVAVFQCPKVANPNTQKLVVPLNQYTGDVTRLLQSARGGDPDVVDELLPSMYDELRRLAMSRLSRETPGQTLQATALVNEVYLRLSSSQNQRWRDRGHFMAAAAEAMRRILIDNARRRKSQKRGGDRQREVLDDFVVVNDDGVPLDDLLTLDDALAKLETKDPKVAELVKLRFLRWSGFHGPVRCLAWGHPRSHCNAQVHPAIFGYKTCLHRSIQTRCSRHACRRALG